MFQAFHSPVIFQNEMMNTSMNSFGMQPGFLGFLGLQAVISGSQNTTGFSVKIKNV
jgi:hypothetical protein